MRRDADDGDFGSFQVLLISQLPAVMVAGGAHRLLELLVDDFQNDAVDVVIQLMPDVFDDGFEAIDQVLPDAGPAGQYRKRIKHCGMIGDGAFGVLVQFLFFDDAGLEITGIVEKLCQILVEIAAADHDFAGTQAAWALIRDLQAAFEYAGNIGAFATVATGIQHLSIVVGGVAIQLGRDLKDQLGEVFVQIDSGFFDTADPAFHFFAVVGFIGGQHDGRQIDRFAGECRFRFDGIQQRMLGLAFF